METGSRFLDALQTHVLVGDGAMGTQGQKIGLEPGGSGELWNIEKPSKVLRIQRQYVEAGADCLTTNTFGASRIMLKRHGCDDVSGVNRRGVEIARQAFGNRQGFVLGNIGPFGGLMEPHGDIAEGVVRDAFEEQAESLVSAGVDAIIIETQTSFEELGLAIEASQKAGVSCVIASLAFDEMRNKGDIKTMMGISPDDAAVFMRDADVDVLALNCGSGVDVRWAADAVTRYRAVCDRPTMAQPNAGLPELENGQVVYKMAPEEMVADLQQLLDAKVNVVGGCCGSTPSHIAAIRRIVDVHNNELAAMA